MEDAHLPPSRPEARLTIAIATYNGRRLLEVALPSLARQTFRDFNVAVIDDASTDDTVTWLGEHWPEVEIVRHERNRGVTAALNTCLSVAHTPLVGLFNNDIEADPRALGELVAALDAHPESGWAGAKLLDFRERDRIDGAGDVFTWAATAGRRGHGERDRGQYDEPRAIFGACGGAAVYRREALDDVGPLDDDFHALYEDVDWNLRAQLAGYGCRYVPTAVVYHMGSETIGRGLTDFTRYRLLRNGAWIVVKDLPLGAIVRHAPQLALGQLAHLAVAVRDRKVSVWLRAMRDAALACPRMLRKRRAVQARRRISVRELELVVGRDGGRLR
ncbi:MAG TPA: glycosyltransferase family 2 protein [Solirubrobacteraceae bacterium]|jgi:hypothetical protein|nr:glycosyltransferase family 2 protein [Solirubrobacteraceae bacterium]